jgi:ATP-binding cassette subfamily C (CFTR/MRP) protein 1
MLPCQVEFLPRCDKVAIMNEGECVYFGRWCEEAAQLLSKYLPASHLLAAAGSAEQPRDVQTKPAAMPKDQVGRRRCCW